MNVRNNNTDCPNGRSAYGNDFETVSVTYTEIKIKKNISSEVTCVTHDRIHFQSDSLLVTKYSSEIEVTAKLTELDPSIRIGQGAFWEGDFEQQDGQFIPRYNRISIGCSSGQCVSAVVVKTQVVLRDGIKLFGDTGTPSNFKESEIDFLMNDDDLASRVQKALGHAVDLAGGRKSPF
jgi:hypothetical protein